MEKAPQEVIDAVESAEQGMPQAANAETFVESGESILALETRKQELMNECNASVASLQADMELLKKSELTPEETERVQKITETAGRIQSELVPLKAQIKEISDKLKQAYAQKA